MRKPDHHDLDRVLKKHLKRASAPEEVTPEVTNELWRRVQHARAQVPARTSPAWPVWATAVATLAVTAGGWMVWQQMQAPRSVEEMAVAALTKESLRFRSQEASEIRTWLRANAGIDIPIPPMHSAMIEIEGADILQGDGAVAEIAYRVGDHRAALLVTKDLTGKRTYPSHEVRPSESFQDARVSSWSMRGQSYTLAWAAPGEFRVACLLCHGQEPRLMN